MQRILTNHNRVVVHLFKSKLEDEGIVCFIKNDTPTFANDIPTATDQPELWVVDNHYLTASHLLRKELTDDYFSKKDWSCSFCREKIERQFDICWQCSASRR